MKSVLVIGMGKFGRHFAKKMIDLGNEVMIVDKDEALVERHAATFSDAQIADCTNKDVLPGPDYCFTERDHLVLIGAPENVSKLSKNVIT